VRFGLVGRGHVRQGLDEVRSSEIRLRMEWFGGVGSREVWQRQGLDVVWQG